MPADPAIHLLPFGADLPARLAEHIAATHAAQLPDLSHLTLLLPSPQSARELRSRLLAAAEARGHAALLGPEIEVFAAWVKRQSPHPQPLLSPHQRELMLVEALIEHPWLYGEGSPWALAGSLAELFDELAARHVRLPQDLDVFTRLLREAYGEAPPLEALSREARLVHTLWQAWQQQMGEAGVIDAATNHLLGLRASLDALPAGHHLYLAGISELGPAEAEWLHSLLERGQASVWLQGDTLSLGDEHAGPMLRHLAEALDRPLPDVMPTDAASEALGQVFADHTAPLRQRAAALRQRLPHSPLAGRLHLFAAGSAEEEARAVDLQTRRLLLAGQRRIAIVTENRRLARRVRALLERAGITLQDAAGWALSTTSAAAVLERWLQCVEEDFAHQPLLDLLKSPFLFPDEDRAAHLATVYRFEQGIVRHEQVARGLARYRHHLQQRQARLQPTSLAHGYDPVHGILDRLQTAATPLLALIDARRHPPGAYLQALTHSLATLGLAQSLAADEAGQRVLEELRQLQAAVRGSRLRLAWGEFRAWLGRTLERYNFQPGDGGSRQVRLMSLMQSRLCRFDALIIAGAEREFLPGSSGRSAFFNDGVRAALGLAGLPERLGQRYYAFRGLLEAADTVHITYRREQEGEAIAPSPWVELLQTFHRQAYGEDLRDRELAQLVGRRETQVVRRDAPLPAPVPPQPAPSLPAELLPRRISASGYQQLMDCPYQFFAARGLGLAPPEAVREMLEKSDYGERVHRCLQAFHQDLAGLPGPFDRPVDADNTAAAIACLQHISEAVFAPDLEDNFLHRGWLARWQAMIPGYVAWQQEHGQQWQARECELRLEATQGGLTLHGRLDRIDQGAAGIDVIDYKTGRVPKQPEIDSGEAVQLPFYALLAAAAMGETVAAVEYVKVDEEVRSAGSLSDADLRQLSTANRLRLGELWQALSSGAALPAWGDEQTCKWCDMRGLCRRDAWEAE